MERSIRYIIDIYINIYLYRYTYVWVGESCILVGMELWFEIFESYGTLRFYV